MHAFKTSHQEHKICPHATVSSVVTNHAINKEKICLPPPTPTIECKTRMTLIHVYITVSALFKNVGMKYCRTHIKITQTGGGPAATLGVRDGEGRGGLCISMCVGGRVAVMQVHTCYCYYSKVRQLSQCWVSMPLYVHRLGQSIC